MKGTQIELAKHLGVNRSSVSRAVKAGRIAPDADGRFDFERCAAAWHANAGGRADVAARHAAQRGTAIPTPQRAPQNATAVQDLPTTVLDAGSGRAGPQAVRLKFENDILKIEMALRRHLRYELASVKREAFGLGAMLRAGLERVVDQTAPRLAACADAAERRRIIAKEVARLDWIIKREYPRALRRMRLDASAGHKSEGQT